MIAWLQGRAPHGENDGGVWAGSEHSLGTAQLISCELHSKRFVARRLQLRCTLKGGLDLPLDGWIRRVYEMLGLVRATAHLLPLLPLLLLHCH